MHTESTTTVATTRKNLLLFLGFIKFLGISGIGFKKNTKIALYVKSVKLIIH